MNEVTTSKTQTTGAPRDMTLEEFLGVPPAGPWRRWRNWIIVGVVAVVVLLVLWRLLSGGETVAYATQPVRVGDLTVSVSATGNLQPTNKVDVGSEQSGLITDVFVDNNDHVTKGQPLARLDTSRLRDTITQNQAAVAAALAQVAQAQASAVQARANLNRLEEVYRLSAGKVPSKTELDTGRAENLRQIAAVRAANAQVTTARATLSSSETNLRKATIYSPVNGVILQRQIDPGQTVAASFQAPVLFTIAEDLSKMKLEVKVDEADVGQVREGQRATFTVDAYPGQVFPAVIHRVDVGANTTTSGSSSSTTSSTNNVVSYIAELAVENPDLMLRPGMTATADIVTKEKHDVLLIPNAALRFNPNAQSTTQGPQQVGMAGPVGRFPRFGGGERQVRIGRGSMQTVYVLGADNEPQAVRVRVGDTNGSLTEIVSGDLHQGQKVILGKLAPGAQQAANQGERYGGQGSRRQDGSTPGQGRRGQDQGGQGPTARPAGQERGAEKSGNGSQASAARSVSPGMSEAPGGGENGGRGGGWRNLPPEQREAMRERFQNASPEERQRMREAWMARRQQAQGNEAAPAGE
jgi:HlyD family secretion protein